MQVDQITVPKPCQLAECPVWNEREGALYWTDIPNGRIWRYESDTKNVEQIFAGEMQIGGIAFAEDDDLVLCTDRGVFLLAREGNAWSGPELLWDVPLADDERFNDVTVDPAGRLWAGTLTARRVDGVLYRFEKDQAPEVMLRGLHTSNGMAFSMDQRWFYHTDSRPRTITRYAYDGASGAISDPQPIYQGDEEDGVPDGLTIDTDDHLWSACYRGGQVLRLTPAGAIEQRVPLPAALVSSVIFGGNALNELYITTAGADQSDEEGRYLGGHLYRLSTICRGRGEFRVRI